MKKILLIISGSIACYKAIELIRMWKKANYLVQVVMTKSAKEFITPMLVGSISGNEVFEDLFSSSELKISHIDLSRQNDLVVIMPATANIINKIANGYADDLASTIILANNKPLIIAPAMNEKMWLNSTTITNIAKLRNNGAIIIEPISDVLACGEEGIGKIANLETIFSETEKILQKQDLLKNKKIIISGGATFESIDPVRFIGNYSSGKQAIYLAEAFNLAGAEVLFITANINLPININHKQILRVNNSKEMYRAISDNLANCHCFIGAAAVADFIPANFSPKKIKKNQLQEMSISLTRNIDILQEVANHANRPNIVIGFAAESENLLNYATTKLQQKNCDFIVANNIEDGKIFNSEQTSAIVIDKEAKIVAESNSKKAVANIIVDIVAKYRG